MSKCNDCIHKSICKFMLVFQQKEEQLRNELIHNSEDGCWKVEITCKYFEDKSIALTLMPFREGNVPIIHTSTHNECANCWVTKRLQDGTPYIGDLPCQWCPYSPYKLTCSLGTTSINE